MLQHKKGNIYIGTSGWNYKHWVGKFYPGGIKNREQLDYYLTKFRTVEVNSSFYHLPAATTCAYWREKSPVDFLFSVKANRYFTHLMKLKVERDMLQDFLKRITPLAEKMGPILFQLPPRCIVIQTAWNRF